MRSTYIAPIAFLVVAIAIGWAGCDDGEITGTAGTTGGGGSSDEASATTGVPGSTCYGALPLNGCTACLEDRCCAPLAACVDAGNCIQCFNGAAECESDIAKAAKQALSDCHDALCLSKCPDPLPEVACDAPAAPPSVGACVIIGAEVQCNPVTNEGCEADPGSACDFDSLGFSCFSPPNGADLCAACGTGNSGFCKGGLACYPVTYTCAKYCCDDGDCGGAGYCDKTTFVYSDKHPVGLCLEIPQMGAGGAGGGGGGGSGAGGSGSAGGAGGS